MVSNSLVEVPAGDDCSREALLAAQPERRVAAGLSLVVTPLALLAALLLVVKMPASAKPVELPAARLATRVEPPDLIQTPPPPPKTVASPSPAAPPAVSGGAPASVANPAPAVPSRITRSTAVPTTRPKRGARNAARAPVAQGVEVWPSAPEPVRRAVHPPAEAVAAGEAQRESEPVVAPRAAAAAPVDELKRPDFD